MMEAMLIGTGISFQAAAFLAVAGVAVGYLLGLMFRTRLTDRSIIGTVTSASSHTTKHATIVTKRRGTSKDGARFVYYMVGPVRYREVDAIEDLTRWQAAAAGVRTTSEHTNI